MPGWLCGLGMGREGGGNVSQKIKQEKWLLYETFEREIERLNL